MWIAVYEVIGGMNEVSRKQATLDRYYSDGKLTSWPVKQSRQLLVLEQLIQDFRPDVDYPEAEVNRIISERYDDYCLIRRMFVNHGFMRRENAVYRLSPEYRWTTFRNRFLQVAEQLRNEYRAKEGILALGCFGSLNYGRLWTHSDLDLLLVVDQEQSAAAYQEYEGVTVHWQILTPKLLAELDQAGLPLLQALASIRIWTDRDGLLQMAVERAKELIPQRLPEYRFRELAQAVAALHLAEKQQALGNERDAHMAAANALHSLAAMQLAEQGSVASRRSFALNGQTPIATELYDCLQTESLITTMDRTWQLAREQLVLLSNPLLQLLASAGPLSYPELERRPELRGLTLSERLLHELCNAGAVVRAQVQHPVVGWEYKFQVADIQAQE